MIIVFSAFDVPKGNLILIKQWFSWIRLIMKESRKIEMI